jgi:hypothetical protein
MSASKPKKPRAKKATKADLEAKIAELETKLSTLSAQVSKPTPPPPQHVETKAQPQPPEPEVAPSYSTSSTRYTGNKYYATRQRLAYHPPDKQFRGGQVAQTVQVPPPPKPAPEPAPEPQQKPRKEKPKRTAPAQKVSYYTGENYYRTRQRLAYHPPDKQFIEPKAIKFEEAPTIVEVEEATSPQPESKPAKDRKSRADKLAEYEREYLERIEQQRAEEAAKPAPAPKQRGTMPAGWK